MDLINSSFYAIQYAMETEAQALYDKILAAIVDGLRKSDSTQEELAHRCGLSQPTIQRIIGGKRGENLPFKTILQIALAMDINLSDLLQPEPTDKQAKLKTLLAEINKMIANE